LDFLFLKLILPFLNKSNTLPGVPTTISVFEDVYVVWGLITNKQEGTSISTYTSAGAGFSVDEAVKAALMEVSVGYLVQENYHEEAPSIPENISTIDDHIDSKTHCRFCLVQ